MAIITISRGSYSKGKEVAEKVAAALGYECISREVLLDASDRFNVPEMRLVRAIHDAPSILARLGGEKQAYIAYIRCALVRRVQKDNVVYHGLAGHLLLKGIPHVVKARIIADLEDRVRTEMIREGISEHEARTLILRDDQERRKWTRDLFGVDSWDSALYDLVLHIHKLTADDAAVFIGEAAGRKPFATTRDAQQKMDDLVVACEVKASLVEEYPDIGVICEFGNVLIYSKSEKMNQYKLHERTNKIISDIDGIYHIEVHSGIPVPSGAV